MILLRETRSARVARAHLWLLSLMLATSIAFGDDERGTVSGRVTGFESGAPLSGVLVTLVFEAPVSDLPVHAPIDRGMDRFTPRATRTDRTGLYLFDAVPAGNYRLSFECVEYAPRFLSGLRVMPGREVRIDPVLVRPIIEHITVRSEPVFAFLPGPSQVSWRGDALRSRPASFQDPLRAIDGVAGIAAQNDFRSELRIRGGEASETKVLLNGLPLPSSHHFTGSAGSAAMINADLIEEAMAFTGGFSAEHGDALAGVVDLTTRDDRPERLSGRAGLGTLMGNLTLAAPVGTAHWSIAGRVSRMDLYDDRVSEGEIDAVSFSDMVGSLSLPFLGGGRLQVEVLDGRDDFEQDLGEVNRAAMESGQRAVQVRFQAPLDERTFLRALASEGKLEVGASLTDGAFFDREERRRDLKISLLRLLGAAHRLSAGMDMARSHAAIAGTVHDGYGILPNALNDETSTLGAFVEDMWTPADRVKVRCGLRADRFSGTGESAISPRLAVEVRPSDGMTLRAATGRFVQFPRQEQVFLAGGEPLRRQTAEHFILGAERRWRGGVRLNVEAYSKRMEDVIAESINRYVELPEVLTRFDEAWVRGIEVSFAVPGPGPWRFGFDYGYMVASQRRGGAIYARNTDLRHAGAVRVGRRLGRGWSVSGLLRYGSGLPYTPQIPWTNGFDFGVALGELNSARLPAYHRLDIRMERAHPVSFGSLSWYLELINVYDRRNVRNVDLIYDPAAGSFRETVDYQSPFLPVVGLAAEF